MNFYLADAPSDLRDLVEQTSKNATWRSNSIQNQIIDVYKDCITESIVTDIKKNKFFSVLADEATDISNKQLMSLVLRYLDESDEVKEKFVSFIHCEDGASGEALAKDILDYVHEIGKFLINIKNTTVI